jgi:hypothetical protein
VATWAFRRNQEQAEQDKQDLQSDKLDSLVLAVVGKPESPDGTFKKVDGLVDHFADYVADRAKRDTAVDKSIAEIKAEVEKVAKEYITNGGSTIKDDLVVVRTALNDLRISVRGVIDAQTQAAMLAHKANAEATDAREGIAQGQEDARVAAEHATTQ